MENASKAIEIAGGILIAVLVISILIVVYNNMQVMPNAQEEALEAEQLAKYNMQFESYHTNSLKGTDIISVINKAIDSNKRYNAENTSDPYYVDVICTNVSPVKNTVNKYSWNGRTFVKDGDGVDYPVKAFDGSTFSLNDNKDDFEEFIELNYNRKGDTYYSDKYGNKDDYLYEHRFDNIGSGGGYYYETINAFSEFKKRSFTCTEVHYKGNGRIDKLSFSEV